MISCYSDELKVSRPGKGTPKEGCGAKLPMICLDCGNHFFGEHYCMSRTCPNCYVRWSMREGFKAANTILYNRHSRSIAHVVVSIVGEPNEVFDHFGTVYKILLNHGISGGLCIPHYERHGEIDGYLHYHCVGYIKNRYKPGSKQFEYVFKVIRFLNKNSEVPVVISYLLSHCAIMSGVHSARYFGQRFKKPSIEKYKGSRASCCICHGRNCYPDPLTDYTGSPRFATEVKVSLEPG